MLVGKLRFGNKFRPRRGALSRFPVECFLKEGERLKIYSEPGAILFTIGSVSCGQSYKASTIVIYNSRVVPDWKIPHITTLES